jgi:hypothetical protein
MTAEQINLLIEAIENPHELCLMCIGLFCATGPVRHSVSSGSRTVETT